MSDALDMTAMYVMHGALRRELEQLAKVTARVDDDPRSVLRTAAGWELFKTSLHVHHTAEDDALWPALRRTLADRPDELVLLEAMEAEHAAIDQVIDAIDAVLTAPETHAGAGLNGLRDLTEALVVGLAGHLRHEEDQALPLVRAFATPRQWAHFGQVHGRRIGADIPRLLPWLLEGADEQTVATLLTPLPEPVRAAYAAQWQPAYAALDRWSVGTTAATGSGRAVTSA
ncbi:hemerythrin domain-containing protein [Sphaerisporangium fuscum]|uniref:hemerythrin domain-containing protein n=1 Tax=Sphaerisporangium fuscum TaxID=2835868 RepID=UPI0027E35E44|nr:hemerythrin domain-containing protein [Sphaerisporangium fuscum]